MKKKTHIFFMAVILLTVLSTPQGRTAVSDTVGFALAAGAKQWNDWKDASQGDSLTDGAAVMVPYFLNGTTFDRVRGDIQHGLYVSVTEGGNDFYAINKTNLTTASVNFSFFSGNNAHKIIIETPSGNTDDVCIDWNGGTAVCPAANVAGDDKVTPGTYLVLNGMKLSSVSAIANSGTQEISIRAYK